MLNYHEILLVWRLLIVCNNDRVRVNRNKYQQQIYRALRLFLINK